MTKSAQAEKKIKKKTPALYDPNASQRFEFTVKSGGDIYDTAHIFAPITDERYLEWIAGFDVNINGDAISENTREATTALWDDLIKKVENIETSPDTNFKDEISIDEKIGSIEHFLAVAIYDPEKTNSGVRKLAKQMPIVRTEAFFEDEVLRQKHTLREPTIEDKKKYARIQSKRIKEEQTRGLRRKPKMEFSPQNEAIGELYDELIISAEGFGDDESPLRFKERVIHELLDSALERKK